jgi:multimeric flavodoxin WrbA
MRHEVSGEVIRLADYHISLGVSIDEGDGDQWPSIRAKILAADILVVSTPIWMGHPASLAQVVMERLDAEISQTRPDGRPTMSGKVAAVAVVGNEDGAHHTSAALFQGLCDVGFTIPAGGPTYWVGEAMGKIDYRDVSPRPEKTALTTRTLAANAAHLARALASDPYPLTT